MNNNADIDFLRFLSRENVTMLLGDALSIMDEARRLYTPEPPREGAMWRGLYFSPEADDALRSPNGLITAIKAVREYNRAPGPTYGVYRYNYSESGALGLKDAKDVCEARRKFLRGRDW